MNVEYMRTAKKSYMIVKGADFPYEPYELTMILRNDIACLIPFQVILEDGDAQYWYDVGGMQSMKTVFSMKSLDGKQIRLLLESLIELKSSMEAYLLDDMNICFSPEMVCFERSRERIRFCYIPGLGSAEGSAADSSIARTPRGRGGAGFPWNGPKRLFEEILQHLDHSDPPAVRMAYEMYERCARGPFTAEDCMDCLRLGEQAAPDRGGASVGEQEILWGNAPDEEAPVTNRNAGEEAADSLRGGAHRGSPERHRKKSDTDVSDGQEAVKRTFWEEEEDELEFLFEDHGQRTGHRKKRRKGREEHFQEAEKEEKVRQAGDIGGTEDDSRTEVISEEFSARTWELVYKGKGMESDLVITESPFLIGTDKSRVNGAINARTVSRVHAKLSMEEGRLFVEDFNSTNGTYLNNSLLPMNTPSELAEGDRVVFATEEYAVYCRHLY